MNRKAMAMWEVLIWGIILVIVAFLVIFGFKNLFGKETGSIDEQITSVTADSDKDGVKDILDKCKNTPEGSSVDVRGCAAGQT